MRRQSFHAPEYHADRTCRAAGYEFAGSEGEGFTVAVDGRPPLDLGPGYRLLRVLECGVCSTDLARHLLPFPLPQVTGHEVVAVDDDGRRLAVEINASHRARGVSADCAFCDAGLDRHCPDRLVLGIDRLPGGFGPFVLAPRHACVPIPDALPTRTAVLIEPFAAALHAVATTAPRSDDTVAVLGPRRLGLLVVAALAAHRRRHGAGFAILALSRHRHLLDLARGLGADDGRLIHADGAGLPAELADVVIDTTGSPAGLATAMRLARREVHVKSTHGRGAGGLDHTTELVVDELRIERFDPERAAIARRVAWLARAAPPDALLAAAEVVSAKVAAAALARIVATTSGGALPRADAAVVDDARGVALAIRPGPDQAALVRPWGTIFVAPGATPAESPVLRVVLERGVRVSSSRCGDFRAAVELLAGDPALSGLGDRLIRHEFAGDRVGDALAAARSPECIKAVVRHAEECG